MDPLAKKKLIIYLAFALAIAVAIAGWYLWRGAAPAPEGGATQGVLRSIFGRILGTEKPPTQPPLIRTTPPPPQPSDTSAQQEKQSILQLTDFPVIAPALNAKEDRILFYKKEGGDLMMSSFHSTAPEKLSNITIVGLSEALWSSSKDRATILYLDDNNIKSFIHIGTSTVALLPLNIRGATWSPDGKSIAYTLLKEQGLELALADASGKNAKIVFRTPLLDAHIQWITDDKIAFLTAPSARAEGYVFTYSRSSGAFAHVLGPLFGLTTRWSPDGKRALFSTVSRSGKQLRLWWYDAKNASSLELPVDTLPEKCVWLGSDETYCATPKNISSLQIWPDEYLRGEIAAQDKIIRIFLQDGQARVETIFDEGGYDMSELLITKNKEFLFFVDRADGTLSRVKLKTTDQLP